MQKRTVVIMLWLAASLAASAQQPYQIQPIKPIQPIRGIQPIQPIQQFPAQVPRSNLGVLNGNPYDPNSISNPYGAGSPYKADGVMNPYSPSGSPYSNTSANNPYATQPPVLIDSNGKYRGELSANPYRADSTSNPYGRYGSPYSPDSVNNPYGAGSPYSTDPIYIAPTKPTPTKKAVVDPNDSTGGMAQANTYPAKAYRAPVTPFTPTASPTVASPTTAETKYVVSSEKNYAGQTYVFPTTGGVRDYTKAGALVEETASGLVAYPTLPGTSVRDFSKQPIPLGSAK
jgi:hypothetical protein